MTNFNLDSVQLSGGTVDINIDNFKITDLVVDLRKQSSLFQYYGKLAIDAKREAGHAELRLKQVSGEKELALRAEAARNGNKLTENQIKAMLATDPELFALQEALIDAEATSDLLDNARRAMDHKKSMIDDAIRLEISGVYNGGAENAIADGVRLNIKNKNLNH